MGRNRVDSDVLDREELRSHRTSALIQKKWRPENTDHSFCLDSRVAIRIPIIERERLLIRVVLQAAVVERLHVALAGRHATEDRKLLEVAGMD